MKTKLLIFFFATLISCNNIRNEKIDLNNSLYEKVLIQYLYGNQEREDFVVYIGKKGDTTGSSQKFYRNNILDLKESCFYELKNEWNKVDKKISGKIKYHIDTIKYGEITNLLFKVETNLNGKKEWKVFKKDKPKNASIEFEFFNNSDTITGFLFAQHLKITDTISQKGNTAYHMSERLLFVDNYNFNNNPFIETVKIEKYNFDSLK